MELKWIRRIKKDPRFKLVKGREYFSGSWKDAISLIGEHPSLWDPSNFTWEFIAHRGKDFTGIHIFPCGSQQFWSKIHRPQRGQVSSRGSSISMRSQQFWSKIHRCLGAPTRGSAPAPRRSAGAGPQVVPPKTQYYFPPSFIKTDIDLGWNWYPSPIKGLHKDWKLQANFFLRWIMRKLNSWFI